MKYNFENCFSRSIDWGGEFGGNCYNQMKLIEDLNYIMDLVNYVSYMKIIEEEFSKFEVLILFFNIIELLSYCKDVYI